MKLLGCCFFGGGFRRCFRSLAFNSLGHNLYLHMRGDFAVQFDAYVEFANALEWLWQLDLATIDLEAVRSQLGSDVGRGD